MIKELLKELNIQFKSITYDKEEDPYDPEFIAKIKRGEKARKEGRGGKSKHE